MALRKLYNQKINESLGKVLIESACGALLRKKDLKLACDV